MNKPKIIFSWVVFLFFVILFLLHSSNANSYYADLEIIVYENGLVDIKGISNYERLLGTDLNNLTSKKKGYWLLNITTDEYFSDAIFRISFPKDVIVNYVKVPKFSRFENTNNNFEIIGLCENQKLNILVQYKLKYNREKKYLFYVFGFFIFLFLVLLVYYFMYYKKKNTFNIDPKKLKKLNERQKEIIDILKKNNNRIFQKKLEKITNIPKSSLSRNIKRLELMDIIEKKVIGMSNLIYLKEKDNKEDLNIKYLKKITY